MAPSDDESKRMQESTTLKTPFTIAARFTTSHKSTKHLKNPTARKPVVPSTSSQKRSLPNEPFPQASASPLTLDMMPSAVEERAESAHAMDEEGGLSGDSTPDVSMLRTPSPGSSVSQTSRRPSKRQRVKTSHIHEYITTRGDSFVCNSCSKVYKISGGTGAVARHLKKAHSIDPTAGGIAEKRVRERRAIDAAILRGAEINIKAEGKRREEMMGIGLDKNTLEYLYLQWTLSSDIPLNHVRDTAFRTFLEYVNPVANRMLPNSESTMKIHAETLLADGKRGLARDDKQALSRLAS